MLAGVCVSIAEWVEGSKAYRESLKEHYGRPRHTQSQQSRKNPLMVLVQSDASSHQVGSVCGGLGGGRGEVDACTSMRVSVCRPTGRWKATVVACVTGEMGRVVRRGCVCGGGGAMPVCLQHG